MGAGIPFLFRTVGSDHDKRARKGRQETGMSYCAYADQALELDSYTDVWRCPVALQQLVPDLRRHLVPQTSRRYDKKILLPSVSEWVKVCQHIRV